MPGQTRSRGPNRGGGRQRPRQPDRLVECSAARGEPLLLGGHVCPRRSVAVDDAARELIHRQPSTRSSRISARQSGLEEWEVADVALGGIVANMRQVAFFWIATSLVTVAAIGGYYLT